MKGAVTKNFKYILVVTAITMILHTAEEYITELWNFDPFILYMSTHFSISGVSIYFTIQALALLLISLVLMLALKNKFHMWLAVILGLVFVLELLHPYNTLKVHGYYSGLYTGILLILVGYFYWIELNKLLDKQ